MNTYTIDTVLGLVFKHEGSSYLFITALSTFKLPKGCIVEYLDIPDVGE